MGRKTKATNDQSLKGRLTRILSAKTDEFNWDTQNQLLREWGLKVKTDGCDLAAPLYKAGITTYLSAPQLAKFGNLKDSATKYTVSHYHDVKFWMDNTVELTAELIHGVTGLPMTGDKVPMDMPSATRIREYLRSEEEGTNSKGLRIGKETH